MERERYSDEEGETVLVGRRKVKTVWSRVYQEDCQERPLTISIGMEWT